MSNPTHSLYDLPALALKATEEYHLSIQLGLDGFSFCISDAQQVLAIESYHHALSQLEEKIKAHEWLQKKYASTNISLVSKRSTLIPAALYDKQEHANYLQFNHQRSEQLEVVADKLQQLDAYQVYGISLAERELINTFFPQSKLRHYGSNLIDSLLSSYQGSDPQLTVHIQDKQMDIVVINQEGLQLFNSFKHQTAEDFIYYTLFVCEQLNLNTESVDLQFIGELAQQSSIYELAYKYIRNIRFGKRNAAIKLSPVINQLPEHFYFNLLHQKLCV